MIVGVASKAGSETSLSWAMTMVTPAGPTFFCAPAQMRP